MLLFEIQQRLKNLGIERTDCKIACREFLPQLISEHNVGVTLTLKKSWYSMNGKMKVIFFLHDANTDLIAKRFMHILNKLIWKNSYKNKKSCLKTISVVEDGFGKKHTHIHCAIGNFPSDFKFRDLPRLVKKASNECFEIDAQHKEDIADSGWIEYITKEIGKRDTDKVQW